MSHPLKSKRPKIIQVPYPCEVWYFRDDFLLFQIHFQVFEGRFGCLTSHENNMSNEKKLITFHYAGLLNRDSYSITPPIQPIAFPKRSWEIPAFFQNVTPRRVNGQSHLCKQTC